MFATDDTIVAIATPPGRGALGVVRLSGPRALNLAGEFLDRGDSLRPRHATFTRVQRVDSASALDEVVATFFPAPHSYTGEHVVEITGHGSPVLLHAMLAISFSRKPSRISSTPRRRCRRGLRSINWREPSPGASQGSTPDSSI